MVAPLLHTRVRDSLEIAYAPEQVLALLEAVAAGQFSMSVDDADADNIVFEMTRKNADIIISGSIRRWQGTESRLDFEGVVDVPTNSLQQSILLAGMMIFWCLIFWACAFAEIEAISRIFYVGAYLCVVFLAFIIYLYIVWRVSCMLIVRDTQDKQRWKAQQEMAQIVREIRDLKSDAA